MNEQEKKSGLLNRYDKLNLPGRDKITDLPINKLEGLVLELERADARFELNMNTDVGVINHVQIMQKYGAHFNEGD